MDTTSFVFVLLSELKRRWADTLVVKLDLSETSQDRSGIQAVANRHFLGKSKVPVCTFWAG